MTGDAVTTGPQLTGSSADMLTVDGISVRLGGRDVLQDVRFAIRAGEFVGLIGSNGAGKTTLLRVILGLQEPSAGTVRIADPGRARHAPAIGYVPQKVLLDPDMPLRARDVVGLGLDGNRLGIPPPSPGSGAPLSAGGRVTDQPHPFAAGGAAGDPPPPQRAGNRRAAVAHSQGAAHL